MAKYDSSMFDRKVGPEASDKKTATGAVQKSMWSNLQHQGYEPTAAGDMAWAAIRCVCPNMTGHEEAVRGMRTWTVGQVETVLSAALKTQQAPKTRASAARMALIEKVLTGLRAASLRSELVVGYKAPPEGWAKGLSSSDPTLRAGVTSQSGVAPAVRSSPGAVVGPAPAVLPTDLERGPQPNVLVNGMDSDPMFQAICEWGPRWQAEHPGATAEELDRACNVFRGGV